MVRGFWGGWGELMCYSHYRESIRNIITYNTYRKRLDEHIWEILVTEIVLALKVT